MEMIVSPYRICTSIFIKVYCNHRTNLAPRENGKICLFILDIIRQNEYSYRQLSEMLDTKCDAVMVGQFRRLIEETIADMNNLFELVKQLRECSHADNNSVAGLFLRKLTIYFERLTHQACSRLYDDLKVYVTSGPVSCAPVAHPSAATSAGRQRGPSVTWRTPRTTRSSNSQHQLTQVTPRGIESTFSGQQNQNQHQQQQLQPQQQSQNQQQGSRQIYQVSHEIARLQANEERSMNPRDLYEALRRPNNACKSDAAFLRYLNLLRVNESVGSKHLLLAYFDMVSDSVPRSYSALNHAIWYLHHGEYKRAIECLQECYCCAQAADDDKCLLISLMWLARILIQAKQKNSSKYNVRALLELVRKRSHKAGMAYVQAMSSLTLDQLTGPRDDSETLKASSETLKQVAQSSRQQNLLHLATISNQIFNPLDEDEGLPSAEILAVRNSMNDVLAMYYALLSAHLNLMDAGQSSALASQTLLHFDLIEKCGNEDVSLVNENTLIAARNLAHHVWNSTRDLQLVREILVDLCMSRIARHRTDSQSILRQAYSEICFQFHLEQENWSEATKMIAVIRETDQDGAQLRQAELLRLLGANEEALDQVDHLIKRIEHEESNPTDPIDFQEAAAPAPAPAAAASEQTSAKTSRPPQPPPAHPSLSVEHRSFIKAKALLLRAKLLDDETKILESLQYAGENRFMHIRSACVGELERLEKELQSSIAVS